MSALARAVRSTALFASFALASCTSVPDAGEPKADTGPLAVCCTKVSEALSRANGSLTADVVRTPEEEERLNAQIAGLTAGTETCKTELTATDRDDAAAIARVKQAAGSFDLALNVPECK